MGNLGDAIFQSAVTLVGAVAIAGLALLYFQRVRLERPSVGVFNARDVVTVGFFIVLLPVLYVTVPITVLTVMLIITFASASYIALRPLLPAAAIWLLAGALIVGNILATYHLLGTQLGWQVYWTLGSALVVLAAVGVSNLYVQGGMHLRHVAYLGLFLGLYDIVFTMVVPLTQRLADTFEGQPLDAAFGFYLGGRQADIGLGDVLVYALFTIAAYKGYGRKGALAILPVVAVCGAIVPGMAPLVVRRFVREGIGIIVPAQIFFGPVAFAVYLWLRRQGPERSTGEWFRLQEQAGRAPRRSAGRRARPAAEPAR
jgi:hypothetical protein